MTKQQSFPSNSSFFFSLSVLSALRSPALFRFQNISCCNRQARDFPPGKEESSASAAQLSPGAALGLLLQAGPEQPAQACSLMTDNFARLRTSFEETYKNWAIIFK